MSRKDRPDDKNMRINGTRWSSMSISLEGLTVVVKKIKDNLSNFKSTDKESKKNSLA